MAGANESRVHCWLAAEHARLHIVAERPDSPGKQALVNAIWSSIQRLMASARGASFICLACDHSRGINDSR